MPKIEEIYQETILEHGQNPRNFAKLKKANYSAEAFNPFCGDRYWVYLKVNRDIIEDISFEGEGCLISKASGSLMTEILKDKTMTEAEKIFMFFQKLITGEKLKEKRKHEKLFVFSGISKFPLRIKCALLPWYVVSLASIAPLCQTIFRRKLKKL